MKNLSLNLTLDRSMRISLAEQIRIGITEAIFSGVLEPGARLPSWLALAAQLGISRGTVKTAYERLQDEQLVVSSRAQGTRVASLLPGKKPLATTQGVMPESPLYQDFLLPQGYFQMGIPADDLFPATLFARLYSASARSRITAPQRYGDPRGELAFRQEIAAQLALSRGVKCHASQVFITTGFTGAFGVILHALNLRGKKAWVENPGFPPARRALELADVDLVPVPVDDEGIDVRQGECLAPDAALALVTPGQQAPLGMTLSLDRRVALLEWATRNKSWIVEDDYLGELQHGRRAAPALASMDVNGRVIHIGSFSKTISPTLRLGFVVVPLALTEVMADVVASLAPAPDPAIQMAVRAFMHDGHFLRHLRKLKRVYAVRSHALHSQLESLGYQAHVAGLSVFMKLEAGAQDGQIARQAYAQGIAPSPLSAWYLPGIPAIPGFLLGLASKEGEQTQEACLRLDGLIRQGTGTDQ